MKKETIAYGNSEGPEHSKQEFAMRHGNLANVMCTSEKYALFRLVTVQKKMVPALHFH